MFLRRKFYSPEDLANFAWERTYQKTDKYTKKAHDILKVIPECANYSICKPFLLNEIIVLRLKGVEGAAAIKYPTFYEKTKSLLEYVYLNWFEVSVKPYTYEFSKHCNLSEDECLEQLKARGDNYEKFVMFLAKGGGDRGQQQELLFDFISIAFIEFCCGFKSVDNLDLKGVPGNGFDQLKTFGKKQFVYTFKKI